MADSLSIRSQIWSAGIALVLVTAIPVLASSEVTLAPGSSLRVGGDEAIQVKDVDGSFYVEESRVTTALPEGYPAPTPPGAIELKAYPTVRRAEVVGSGNPDAGQNSGFWPLFRHIQRRDIPMTSPVEMDYRGLEATESDIPESWSMSFLYRTPNEGPEGKDGVVEVYDTEPIVVASIGFAGPYTLETVRSNLRALEDWIIESDYRIAGEPRALFYNGPMMPRWRQWGEVQLPIEPVASAVSNDESSSRSVAQGEE